MRNKKTFYIDLLVMIILKMWQENIVFGFFFLAIFVRIDEANYNLITKTFKFDKMLLSNSYENKRKRNRNSS